MFDPSPEYRAYRAAFDALVRCLEREPGYGTPDRAQWSAEHATASEAADAALVALQDRPASRWSDVAEFAIVAHDHAWNRHSQRYDLQSCPADIVAALTLKCLALQPGDAVLHSRPAGWVSPVQGSPTTISN